MVDRLWKVLDDQQADGFACVICGRDFVRDPARRLPVGWSVTDSQVFACIGECTDLADLDLSTGG